MPYVLETMQRRTPTTFSPLRPEPILQPLRRTGDDSARPCCICLPSGGWLLVTGPTAKGPVGVHTVWNLCQLKGAERVPWGFGDGCGCVRLQLGDRHVDCRCLDSVEL